MYDIEYSANFDLYWFAVSPDFKQKVVELLTYLFENSVKIPILRRLIGVGFAKKILDRFYTIKQIQGMNDIQVYAFLVSEICYLLKKDKPF